MIKLPTGVNHEKLIDDLRILSWEAYEILIDYSQILKDSNNKSNILKNNDNNNPVTLADLKVNEIIIQKIEQKYRNIHWSILSEENVKLTPLNRNKNIDWLWVLDPLDGTKDFIQGTNNYAMHLALNYKQKPLIGIVLIPEKDELWIANGKEVWCEKKNGSRIEVNRSKDKKLNEMILVTSKNHRNSILENLIQKISFEKVIEMGSIGCKIASIVRGESDIYICLSLPGKSSPKDWDFASPEAILRASGGAITDINNRELTYGKQNFEQGGIIVASNNINVHKELCFEIKTIIEENELFPF